MFKPFLYRKFFTSAIIIGCIIAMNLCALAKEDWQKIPTKNFQIISNTKEKDLQNVQVNINYLEYVFSRYFTLNTSKHWVPTNLLLFENDENSRKFKPVEDGKVKNWVAGYFQPGEDVNYIVLFKDENNFYSTIYHEYTHSLVDNYFEQENIPPWINEGLAEYFENLEIRDKDKVKLGIKRFSHGQATNNKKLEPLDDFFQADYKQIRKKSKEEIETFYYQSWLLIHYILNGTKGERNEKLKMFLNSVLQGNSPNLVYKELFGKDLNDLENKLNIYSNLQNYPYEILKIKNYSNLRTKEKSLPISNAEALAFQGDLFQNIRYFQEAENYLEKALKLDPNLVLANASLGKLKMKLGDFEGAKKYLEKAIEKDSENFILYYRYAYMLSREDADQLGFIRPFEKEKLELIRNSLKKAMLLNPNYSETFYLYSFINLVQNSDYEEGIKMLEKAIKLSPENNWYQMRLSEFYYRLENIEKAEEIALKVIEKTIDTDLREYALRTLKVIENYRENIKKESETEKKPDNFVRASDGVLTEEEQKILEEKVVVEVLNQMLRKPQTGEERMVGVLSKVDCGRSGINYLIESNEQGFEFKSPTFKNLRVSIFNLSWKGEGFGCGSTFPDNLVIVTYRPQSFSNQNTLGEIVSIEFVPKYFRFPANSNSANN